MLYSTLLYSTLYYTILYTILYTIIYYTIYYTMIYTIYYILYQILYYILYTLYYTILYTIASVGGMLALLAAMFRSSPGPSSREGAAARYPMGINRAAAPQGASVGPRSGTRRQAHLSPYRDGSFSVS